MKNIGDKVVSGFRWLAAGRLAGQAVTWIITIFVIRILSPEDFGLMAMATVVIGFLALFDELGMGSALIQQEEFDDKQVAQVFGLVIVINIAAFILLVSVAPLIADFFGEERLVLITWVLSLQFPMLALQVIPDAIIRRRMEFRAKSLVNFVTMVAGSLVSLALALLGYGVWALVIGNIVTVLTRTIGFNIVARYFCWPTFSFTGLRRVVTFGTQVTVERVFWFIYSQADIFLVGRVLGKELLGFYSVAIHLASLPMTKLGGIVNEVSFAGFSRIQSDSEQVSNQLRKATRVMSFFAFPVFFGVSATAPEITSSILGAKWETATIPLQILSLVIPLRMLELILPTALMGTGRADVSMWNAAIAAVILPIGFAIGLRWGLEGVCYAWLIGYSLYFAIAILRSMPVLGVGYGEYLSSVAGVATSAGVMLAAVHGTRLLLPDAWGSGLLSLVVLISVGVAVYLILVLVFHRDTLRFCMKLFGR